MTVTLKQINELPDKSIVDKGRHWVLVLPAAPAKTLWPRVPYGKTIQAQRSRLAKPEDNEVSVSDLPNDDHTHMSHVCLKRDIQTFELLGVARKLITAHRKFEPKQLSMLVIGFDGEQTERIYEALISAALATTAKLPAYKKQREIKKPIRQIVIYGCSRNDKFARSFAMANGNQLTRRLSMLPPNKLRPAEYRREVEKLAKEYKWDMQFYGVKELKKRKAGAFLAVCQGSPVPDAGIVKLTYRPREKTGKTLALVGKGICYDTGGTNLKPAKFMFGMHEDMQGSAVALGTLLALSQLQVDFKIECWLALAMNHIGPHAYKPNDVVTASDGTNIEVVHTDAEGRMVLSDTLIFASKAKPDLILDYATLTGACVYSLGTAYSGVFTNKVEFIPTLITSGEDSGERVWPFPMDDDYDEHIKSDIADVKQCSLEGGPDHILAARFLQRFIKNDTPWVHVDLSSSNRKGGLAHIPTDTTGFGIRFTLDLLLDKQLLG